MVKQVKQNKATSLHKAKANTATTSFPIVAIGASAGGLECIEIFLKHIPLQSNIAFVVIQHLDPTHKGMMPKLLQRATLMPVAEAKNRMKVQPNCVYVIPPNNDISILHDILYLIDPVEPRGYRLPIDYFFRALAIDRRETAVGLIFSGMGSDGTLGIKAIKEHGGLALVQEPSTANFDSMPSSAIKTGLIDYVAPIAELASRLTGLSDKSLITNLRPAEANRETKAQKSAFDKICILIRAQTSHDFSLYKKSTIYRRVERRMVIHQIDAIADYVRFLNDNRDEIDFLFHELLIGVTNFFRDIEYWNYLKDHALPTLLATYPKGGTLRAWVAGCSTGEEAYSLAIIFKETIEQLKLSAHYSLQIFATDIDPDAVEKARQGFYPANIAADISEERLKCYFTEENKGFRVRNNIRQMVVFATQNLILDPPFTKLDILSCRNLLIYFGPKLQKKVLPLFHYSLKPNSILMLGSAETIGEYHTLFHSLDKKLRLFRRGSTPVNTFEVDFPARQFMVKNPIIEQQKLALTPDNIQVLANQLLLEKFSPAGAIVTRDGDIVYINGRTGKYLEPPSGKANWNIYVMARNGLRQEISAGLPIALRDQKPYQCRHLIIDNSQGSQTINLTIYPIDKPDALHGMAAVMFEDIKTREEPSINEDHSRKDSASAEGLEDAYEQSQDELRTLREEMQGSHEEIKSANEELQSTNEELQSTNEELTTSKEEMQSLNEELQTVNIELQSKVEELSGSNNDMKNLLNSTDMATVFLDSSLHIRRFTNQATTIFKLISSDIGRPLSDIVSILEYDSLMDDAEQVLRTLALSECEVTTNTNEWYQIKILPYRTLENVIDGVVITINNISRYKRLEAELRDLLISK